MINKYWLSEEPVGDPRPQDPWRKHPRLNEPTTIFLAIGAVIAVAGAAISAVGQIQQGKQAKKAAEFRSAVAQRNAAEARAQAARDAETERKKNFRRLGAIKAAGSASGLQLAGSVIDVFQSSVIEGELEVENILHKGELRAQGFEAESTLQLTSGENAEKAGQLGAAGSVVAGIGSVADAFGSAARLNLISEALA